MNPLELSWGWFILFMAMSFICLLALMGFVGYAVEYLSAAVEACRA